MPRVVVWLLPQLIKPDALEGATAVVIDQLRATTTLCQALEMGCERAFACCEVEEAREVKCRLEREGRRVLLGGERKGVLIEGFDLSNTPELYTRERLAGFDLVFTTTNGTRAMHAAGGLPERPAARVLLGCLSSLSALVDLCAGGGRDVHIVCAGTVGEVSQEDVLVVGTIVETLMERGWEPGSDDSSRVVRHLWREAQITEDGVYKVLAESRGGRNLRRLGLEADVRWCSVVDRFGAVGEFHSVSGMVTRAM